MICRLLPHPSAEVREAALDGLRYSMPAWNTLDNAVQTALSPRLTCTEWATMLMGHTPLNVTDYRPMKRAIVRPRASFSYQPRIHRGIDWDDVSNGVMSDSSRHPPARPSCGWQTNSVRGAFMNML